MTGTLQPILYSYDLEQEVLWVNATPFRAHLRHLLAAGLTEPVIARLAGVSVRSVVRLAHGRSGRPVRRICADTGRRLLRITTAEARAIRFRPVPVRSSRYRLRVLADHGWSTQRMAEEIGLGIRDVEQVLGRGAATCSQLVALKISAAFDEWDTEQELPARYAPAA